MELSKEQQKLAHTESTRALGIAPAGSGKTRTLIGRILYLIQHKYVSPYEILVTTFTRKAATELKERLSKEIGPDAYKITAGTFHGIALDHIQRFAELVGLNQEKVTVYGSWEEQFLLKDVAQEIGYHNGRQWKKVKAGEVQEAFKLFYTTNAINPENIGEKLLMAAFFDRCRENNTLTYGTILTTFLRLIPMISQYLNFRHIMTDETQDMNPIQWQIANDLCKHCGAALFSIGDTRQAIYKFNGADPEYLIRNQSQFDVYHLRDNYRSVPEVVMAANNLIRHNPNDIGEPMRAIRTESSQVRIVDSIDSAGIVGILSVQDNSDTAVLSRNHYLLKKLSELLTESGINHQYVGKESGLVRSEEFRRVHAFLKLVVNPFDNFSFLLIRDYLGVSPQEYGEIRLKAIEEGKSHYQVWAELYDPNGISHCWEAWFRASCNEDFENILDWMKDVPWEFDPEPIFKFIHEWRLENPEGTIDQYLNWLATFDIQDEVKEDSPGLQLMTVHGSKGLEFKTVIIAGLNEDVFPDKRAVKANDLTEERRLAYVAWTRAEDQLIVTSRPVKEGKDNRPGKEPSRFIFESVG